MVLCQCLALPKDPQSFGSQNLRCPFLVSQYYGRRRQLEQLHWQEGLVGKLLSQVPYYPLVLFLKLSFIQKSQ